ncbi:exopolyphosphatase [Arenibacter sp. F20364]|uniref:Ppx/GppA phosphatase family protein n=1 Tax=Arenibacter sp. F20364 TaxID=2926415 RepID=UPI001FF6C4B1|nr:exopolyphosphatase [Arenibacter sp. F20364]MCK0188467.1 exopolyphosphatase [Arenibacter sp. F20364]
MKVRKYAAIDIGSNAIRLLTHNVIEEEGKDTLFRKSALVRLPIRLGEDVFKNGIISKRNEERLLNAMKAFQLLMDVHGVEKYMACATSAMREADNGQMVIDNILEASGVKIQLIDGEREASIIASTDLKNLIRKDETYLYIDVGGGSTEFTLFSEGKIKLSESFKIGTVRLLNGLVDDAMWNELKLWLKKNVMGLPNLSIIGSGGNINKLHKMSGRKEGESLSYIWLRAQYNFLASLTFEERVSELGLNPDRADVIIPATQIFVSSAKWIGAKKIHVPKIGLSDGIIKTLYYTQE